VDLDVRYGELLMLVGPSGSGKTTLLSIIARILDPDGGECRVLEHNVQRMARDERVHFRGRSIGFVFQAFNLLSPLTAAENVAIPLLINGARRESATRAARSLLEDVGLAGRADALPG
jgi:putative ABC transport system ATP-binding protein